MSEPALHYTGLTLDRAAGRRTDSAWVDRIQARQDAEVIPLWRDQCLVRSGLPVTLSAAEADLVLATASERVLLGLDGPAGVFAADLSDLEQPQAVELTGASGVLDIRRLVGTLTTPQATTLAYARGILHWNRNQRFCGKCGGATESRDGGHLRVCQQPDCAKLLFPRIEPAVIVLVEAPGSPRRCLLGRHRGAAADAFATLAGFVEVGESLEDAVRREVAEEAGVLVGPVAYQASQAWPFPAGLMIAFRATALSEATAVDHDELEEARWFTAAELRQQLDRRGRRNVDSIEKFLIDTWLNDNP